MSRFKEPAIARHAKEIAMETEGLKSVYDDVSVCSNFGKFADPESNPAASSAKLSSPRYIRDFWLQQMNDVTRKSSVTSGVSLDDVTAAASIGRLTSFSVDAILKSNSFSRSGVLSFDDEKNRKMEEVTTAQNGEFFFKSLIFDISSIN